MRRLLLVLAVTLSAAPAVAQASSSTLAFTEGAASGVYTVPAAGGTPSSLSGGFVPSFSPNGKLLAFVNSTGVLFTGAANGKGGRHTLASDLGNHPSPAAFSPNSKQVAYASGSGGLYVINATGGNPKQIYGAGSFDDSASHPVWSNNGKTIYFIQAVQGVYNTSYVLSSVPATGGKPTMLSFSSGVNWALTDFSLSISSSGRTLAVTLGQYGPSAPGDPAPGPFVSFAVGLVPTTGGTATAISGYSAPAFGPTGTNMCAQSSAGGLVVLTPSGQASTPILAGVNPTACTWVP